MKTKKTQKTQNAAIPMSRNEFKDAISKLTRNELIGLLCDIYYAHATDNAKGGCECDCGCGRESKKTPAKKAKVSKKK